MALDQLAQQSSAARRAFFERYRARLVALAAQGQAPDTLFVGCNDSRIMPEAITGAGPGDLFVVRTVANIVPPAGVSERAVGATIEYAVGHLGVTHIVICGHTDCGGIKALDGGLSLGIDPYLALWLNHARPAQTIVDARSPRMLPTARHLAIVEQNVRLQLQNLSSYETVRRAVEAASLTLHGWVYHLNTGRLSSWDPDQEAFVEELWPE